MITGANSRARAESVGRYNRLIPNHFSIRCLVMPLRWGCAKDMVDPTVMSIMNHAIAVQYAVV